MLHNEGNLLNFVRARAHVSALMTQKSCAVGMRNTKLKRRNRPKHLLIIFENRLNRPIADVCR